MEARAAEEEQNSSIGDTDKELGNILEDGWWIYWIDR
jgi:hypothetical protein